MSTGMIVLIVIVVIVVLIIGFIITTYNTLVTLRNRVGHIVGTGVLSRKYMFSSDTIILEIIHQDISILTE